MRKLRSEIDRRTVIEAYVKYDSIKKSRSLPDTGCWPWGDPNGLDLELEGHGYKHGIISGYRSWTFSALTLDDLRECAIVAGVIPNHPPHLGKLESTLALRDWRPDRETDWYERLSLGAVLSQNAPLVLRLSVRSEHPAKWYIEDGSGRALAIMQAASSHVADQVVAYGYIAENPDYASTFMQCRFSELLQSQ